MSENRVVWEVFHERLSFDVEENKGVGYFSSPTLAMSSVVELSGKPGFREFMAGFRIELVWLDVDRWVDGFVASSDPAVPDLPGWVRNIAQPRGGGTAEQLAASMLAGQVAASAWSGGPFSEFGALKRWLAREGHSAPTFKSVFEAWHVRPYLEPGLEDAKVIGVYSSRARAEEAIERVSRQRGFVDYPDGFGINERVVDKVNWAEGFVTDGVDF